MSAPVDVLAVMDSMTVWARLRADPAWAAKAEEARAAVAELIVADTELDAAIAAYDNAITIMMGGVDYVSPSDPAVERFDAAKARRAAALARVGGAA